jgi:stress-induced morphogen
MMHTDNTATGNTSPATRMERIRTRLETALSPLECVLEDDSARHRGHAGAASGGGHYNRALFLANLKASNSSCAIDWCMIPCTI